MRKFKLSEYVVISVILMGMLLLFEGQYMLFLPYVYNDYSLLTQIIVAGVGVVLITIPIAVTIKGKLFSNMELKERYTTPYHYIKNEEKKSNNKE